MRAPTTALSPSSRPVPSHSREDTSPPPFLIRAEGVTSPPFPLGRGKGTQGHAAPLPVAPGSSPSPLTAALYVRARHPQHPCPFARKGGYEGTPPRMRGKGAREGTPLPAPSPFARKSLSPSPFGRAALYARGRGTRGHATPEATPFAGKGVHEGTEGHPVATGPSPSPFDRAALYTRERGARARDPRSHPSRSRGRGTTPPSSLGGAAPYARRGSTRGHTIPDATPFAVVYF
ncbi:hypothetical protein EDB85DRAFT_2170255 [Lactarius pseudohatsudake]|nr:hypothetical protein EDB85DRAFT_2170255 [Lactarius pseudohatsudake]